MIDERFADHSPESMAMKSAEWLQDKLGDAGFTVKLTAEPAANMHVGKITAQKECFKGGSYTMLIEFSAVVSNRLAIGSVSVALKGMAWGDSPARKDPIDLQNEEHLKLILIHFDAIKSGLNAIQAGLRIEDLIASDARPINVIVFPE
ncbi:MAG: hypothetical protein H6773_04250 [Pseudomonadales bacterium]|nr:hypothetical protein [Pseudomonadales bacterium]